MDTLTQDQRRRILQALDETRHAKGRAMRYSPEFRDHDLIAFYDRHILKLTTALSTNTLPPDCRHWQSAPPTQESHT
ncbi:MAG TPA: hypothetical protein VHY82_15975 [Acetobacteraceae bacterium]|jgi:hypothetical protein|nr:hypothetical protein [Acetobacteraceae bacterium]